MKKLLLAVSLILALLILAVGFVYAYREYRLKSYPREYSETVSALSIEFDVPEPIIYAVIRTESGFDKDAKSGAGALGLMQLMPDTYSWLAKKVGAPTDASAITEPGNNLRVGVYYLSYLYGRFGSWEVALAGYNAGHGRVSTWLDDSRYSTDGKTLTDIPIAETKDYVNRVIKSRDVYIELYYGGE